MEPNLTVLPRLVQHTVIDFRIENTNFSYNGTLAYSGTYILSRMFSGAHGRYTVYIMLENYKMYRGYLHVKDVPKVSTESNFTSVENVTDFFSGSGAKQIATTWGFDPS